MLIDFYKEITPSKLVTAVAGNLLKETLYGLGIENNHDYISVHSQSGTMNITDVYTVAAEPVKTQFLNIYLVNRSNCEYLYQIVGTLMASNACSKIIIRLEIGNTDYRKTMKEHLIDQARNYNFSLKFLVETHYLLIAIEEGPNLQTRTLCL